jgi:hypothetical protein
MNIGVLKEGINYIVTKTSKNGYFKKGERLQFIYDEGFSLGEYQLFGSPKEEQVTFFGMKAMNCVRYFETPHKLLDVIEGLEVKLDIEWADRQINSLQKKIDKLKKEYF